MELSLKNEEYLDVYFSELQHQISTVKEHLTKDQLQERLQYKELCQDLNYKYLLSIDGWVSPWLRPALLLKSNSVPLIVESQFTPLYFKQWVPWVHYVPIKLDLSDLITKIQWLQQHDDIAYEIAQNGNNLYETLYTYENMQEDTVSVFT